MRTNDADEKVRGQHHWRTLRKHIQEMRHKANHLVMMLSEANEKKLETKYGNDQQSVKGKYDDTKLVGGDV